MPNRHLESRFKNLPDIIRTYNFEVIIPDIKSVSDAIPDVEDLTLRARSVTLPSRGNEKIESNFGAMKQFFPGKPIFSHTTTIVFEELEDQMISRVFFDWANKLIDTRPNSPTGGMSQAEKKRDLCKDLIIRLFDYNGESLDRAYKLYNAFPENQDEISLDYTDNSSIKIPITFNHDFWELIRI